MLILGLISLLLLAGLWNLYREKTGLEKEAKTLKAELEGITRGVTALEKKVEYFKNPENLLKEAKSQFNYRASDEKLIIIVPSVTSTE